MSDEQQQHTVRFKRPLDIFEMIVADKKHIAQARNILKRRYGFSDTQIDLEIASRGGGRAPIAAGRYAKSVKPDPWKSQRGIVTRPNRGTIF